MSSITVHYTPAFSSDPVTSSPFICHRVCYRFNGTGAYCCVEDATASLAGVPKTLVITVSGAPCGAVPPVDTLACAIPAYDGYVQACCETEGTFDGAEFFTAVFTPDPDCVNKLTCCVSNQPLTTDFFTIVNGGTGYIVPPAVTIVRDPFDPVPSSVLNDAVVTSNLTMDAVSSFTVGTAGLYGKIPTVVIASPGGADATATAILVIPCTGGTDTYWDTCDSAGSPSYVVNLMLGECTNHCYPKAYPFVYDDAGLSDPPNTTDYTYAPGGCCDCTTCLSYTLLISSVLPTVDIAYILCQNLDASPAIESELVYLLNQPNSGDIIIPCAIPGSIYCINDPNAIVSIVSEGPCLTCP